MSVYVCVGVFVLYAFLSLLSVGISLPKCLRQRHPIYLCVSVFLYLCMLVFLYLSYSLPLRVCLHQSASLSWRLPVQLTDERKRSMTQPLNRSLIGKWSSDHSCTSSWNNGYLWPFVNTHCGPKSTQLPLYSHAVQTYGTNRHTDS